MMDTLSSPVSVFASLVSPYVVRLSGQGRVRMLKKIQKKFAKTASDLNYKFKEFQYAKHLPALEASDQQIIDEIKTEGVAIRTLEELQYPDTQALQQSFQCLIRDLEGTSSLLKPGEMDYKTGFTHCVPANPSRIAQAYPDLYLWGMSDRILDMVENYIGLPVAYHGVIARKEINDAKQVGSRRWHYDQEDRNIIRISIYLNDVGVEDGPFEYIPKPVTPSPRSVYRVSTMPTDEELETIVPRSQWKSCPGKAGTVVFAATAKVLHHGKVPTSTRERIAVSYYYTSRQPTGAELCRTFSFSEGVPYITQPLSQRQRDCLWEYQDLLPATARTLASVK